MSSCAESTSNELFLREEAQVHEAFSQLQLGLLLLLEALLEFLLVDETLVDEQLADALALVELDCAPSTPSDRRR